ISPLWSSLDEYGFGDHLHPDLPLDLPQDDPHDQWHHAVAGRGHNGSSALAFVAHDVFVVAIRLVAPHAEAESQWHDGIGAKPVEGLLGEAKLWIDGVEHGDVVISSRGAAGAELDIAGPTPTATAAC